MEMLTNIYLQYGEVGYLIMPVRRICGVKEEMVSIFHVLISKPIKNDLRNNRDDNRKKESKNTHNAEFRRSRHLKVGVSVGAVNNKDYKFN